MFVDRFLTAAKPQRKSLSFRAERSEVEEPLTFAGSGGAEPSARPCSAPPLPTEIRGSSTSLRYVRNDNAGDFPLTQNPRKAAQLFHIVLSKGAFVLAVWGALLIGNTVVAEDAVKKFGLLDLAGREVHPFAAPQAKATVFLFVRTDCPVSNSYAPEMERLYTRFSRKGVSFWLVYLDRDESRAAIRKHQEEFGLTLPALRDFRHALVDLCGARVTPEAAVFSRDRTKMYVGRIDDRFPSLGKSRPQPSTHDLEAAISATLAGELPAKTTALAVGCPIADLK